MNIENAAGIEIFESTRVRWQSLKSSIVIFAELTKRVLFHARCFPLCYSYAQGAAHSRGDRLACCPSASALDDRVDALIRRDRFGW